MGIILWIILGGLVGWVASMIIETDWKQGVLLNIVFGIIGAAIGGWIMNFFGSSGITGFNVYSFMVAFLGAIVLIAIVKAVQKAKLRT